MTKSEFDAVLSAAAKLANDLSSDHPLPGDWNLACHHIHNTIRAITPADCGLDLGGDGFVLVPREPTQSMIAAAVYAQEPNQNNDAGSANTNRLRRRATKVYASMLSAAPPSGIATNKGGDDERG